ncbi:pyridoxamine 5-phosphate oxidase [Rhodococcus sp. WMMA185]|uniref:pyridoxamine 5'-phosphate oxidase family protein n=1 Tax=Rhodococcus sp. WMMA185 TaxID=679318 RepID=UPI000878D5B8|nr:pyridoxamine 5'-phosphate oxidase family protein [Rhodococcus sp. WMMA185]AOW92379.1 pyridoxamine 5-phosphate oxidase [Rhodococcus sp. WMMA185]
MTTSANDSPGDPVTVLTAEESWDLLGTEQLGRLVVSAAGRVDVFPVNYVTHAGKILFRTAQGTKLVEITINREVAFEADHVGPESGWSVVVHGMARQLQTSQEIAAAEELPLHSWVPTPKYDYVEITPTEISGRQLLFGPDPVR